MGYTWENFDDGGFRSASNGRRNQSVGDFRSGGWGGGVLSRSKFICARNWRLRPRKGGFFCEDGGGRPNPYSCTGATVVVLIVIGATVVVLIVVVVLVMMVAVAPATVVVLVVVLVMVTMVAVVMVISVVDPTFGSIMRDYRLILSTVHDFVSS